MGWLQAMALAAALNPGGEPAREQSAGDFTLRANTVASTALDRDTARANGIERRRGTKVMNVVVLRGPDDAPLAQNQLRAAVRTVDGTTRVVTLRPARTNGDTVQAFVGSFEVRPGDVLDLQVSAARPDGADPLSLRWRERVPEL